MTDKCSYYLYSMPQLVQHELGELTWYSVVRMLACSKFDFFCNLLVFLFQVFPLFMRAASFSQVICTLQDTLDALSISVACFFSFILPDCADNKEDR